MLRAAAFLLLAALAGCGGMAGGPPGGAAAGGRQPTAIAVSTEQGGRFIGLTGPRLQHTEPFLGVPARISIRCARWIDRRKRRDRASALCRRQLCRNAARLECGARCAGPPAALHPDQQKRDHLSAELLLCRGIRRRDPRSGIAQRDRRADRHLSARSGAQKTIAVPGELVRAQVVGLDRVRAGLATAAAAPPATAPPRP